LDFPLFNQWLVQFNIASIINKGKVEKLKLTFLAMWPRWMQSLQKQLHINIQSLKLLIFEILSFSIFSATNSLLYTLNVMESKEALKAFKLYLKACQVACGSTFGFNLISQTLYHKTAKRLQRCFLYLGSICLHLNVVICFFNLSAPAFFGIQLLKSLISVLFNILTALRLGPLCIPSKQLCLNPAEICGAINHLEPIIVTAVAGTLDHSVFIH